MASESYVLLKNEKILPLSQKQKVIWVGPYVTSKEFLSRWAIFGEHEPVEKSKIFFKIRRLMGYVFLDAECFLRKNAGSGK